MSEANANNARVSTINLIRSDDLIGFDGFQDVRGLIGLLFPHSDVEALIQDPDIQKKLASHILLLNSMPMPPGFHERVSELMGVSVNLVPSGMSLRQDFADGMTGDYHLSWNFYLDEGMDRATSLHEVDGQFCANDLYVGFFLEDPYQVQPGLPLGGVPAIPMFSGKVLGNPVANDKFSASPIQILSQYFSLSAGAPFEQADQGVYFSKQQAVSFADTMDRFFEFRNESDSVAIAKLHEAIGNSFNQLLPRMSFDTHLILGGRQPGDYS